MKSRGRTQEHTLWDLFFSQMFEQKGLVDLAPLKIMPTWRNKRSGEQAVSKRLDRFLVLEHLIGSNLILKASIETGGNSYHCPIILTIHIHEEKPPAPFKFKPQWLEEEEYCNIILEASVPLEPDNLCKTWRK